MKVNKEKFKKFVAKDFPTIVFFGCLGAAIAGMGYKTGVNVTQREMVKGLEKMFEADPELQERMWLAIGKANGSLKP